MNIIAFYSLVFCGSKVCHYICRIYDFRVDIIADIFGYRFMMNAMLASVLSGLVCGIIGTYVVARRTVFLSGGITHASFGGIGIAYYFGANPILGATIFAVLSALGIEWVSGRRKIREDSAIGIMWSVGMAIGIIFIYLTPGYVPNLMSFLFGNILTVTRSDLAALGILAVVVLAVFGFAWRQIVFVAFDRQFARSMGVPVNAISYFMAVLVALAIVFSIKTVGIVLLISLLTLPAVIANSFTKRYGRITVWSVVFGVLGNMIGLIVSYYMNIPAGAATIFVLVLTLIIVKLLPLSVKQARGK